MSNQPVTQVTPTPISQYRHFIWVDDDRGWEAMGPPIQANLTVNARPIPDQPWLWWVEPGIYDGHMFPISDSGYMLTKVTCLRCSGDVDLDRWAEGNQVCKDPECWAWLTARQADRAWRIERQRQDNLIRYGEE